MTFDLSFQSTEAFKIVYALKNDLYINVKCTWTIIYFGTEIKFKIKVKFTFTWEILDFQKFISNIFNCSVLMQNVQISNSHIHKPIKNCQTHCWFNQLAVFFHVFVEIWWFVFVELLNADEKKKFWFFGKITFEINF